MSLYAAIDLHANNSYCAIVDEGQNRVYKKRLPNDLKAILREFDSFRSDIKGVVVESTYNWYWLVDGLTEAGYRAHLANTTAIKQYSGLKHTNDKSDAFWLAELLWLNVLPEGYTMPREERSLRDLLRRRTHLKRLRTSLIISNQCTVARNFGLRIGANDLNRKTVDELAAIGTDEMVLMSLKSGKAVVEAIDKEIERIEAVVESRVSCTDTYRMLLTIPGVGKILAMTILLETGLIERFRGVGNYVSYCRKVKSAWTSNDRVKGSGNKRNGNAYLAWAFSEAAQHALRASGAARAFYERKARSKHFMVAHGALAHKLARAAYYIMRDTVPFDEKKLFGPNTDGGGKPVDVDG